MVKLVKGHQIVQAAILENLFQLEVVAVKMMEDAVLIINNANRNQKKKGGQKASFHYAAMTDVGMQRRVMLSYTVQLKTDRHQLLLLPL